MMSRRVAILGTLAAIVFGGCGAPPTNTPEQRVPVQQPPVNVQPQPQASPSASGAKSQAIQVETLAKGLKSDMRQPGFQVIRSQGELDSLIQQAGIKEAVPDVDWKEEMVLAVFAGDRPGSIEVLSLTDKGDGIQAKVSLHGTASGSDGNASANASTRAYHLVVLPKSDEEITVSGLPTAVPAASATPAPAASPSAAPDSQGQGQAQGSDQGGNVVKLVAAGPQSGVKQPVNVVIRTADELKSVWDVHKQGLASAAAMPDIDLSQRSIIGIFVGQSQQAGGIEIKSIEVTQQGVLTIKGNVTQGNGQAASPYIMLSIPKLPEQIPVDVQIQGQGQAQTLGNPQQQQAQQPTQTVQRPGFGQPVPTTTQPGFGQPVGGSSLGGTPYLGGANAQPPFPSRGGLVTGGGSGGLLGAGGGTGWQ